MQKKRLELYAGSILGNPAYEGYSALAKQDLQKRLEEERLRAISLDEKTFKMSMALTIGLTILGSVGTMLSNQVTDLELKAALSCCFSVGLLYLLSSGFVALGALRTQPSYGYGTALLVLEDDKVVLCLADALARQETINLMRHLRNETAYQSLRNGLVLLTTAISVLVVTYAAATMTSYIQSIP